MWLRRHASSLIDRQLGDGYSSTGELKLNIPLTTKRKAHINSKIRMSLNYRLSLHLSRDAALRVLLDGHAGGSGAMEVDVQPLSISAVPHAGLL